MSNTYGACMQSSALSKLSRGTREAVCGIVDVIMSEGNTGLQTQFTPVGAEPARPFVFNRPTTGGYIGPSRQPVPVDDCADGSCADGIAPIPISRPRYLSGPLRQVGGLVCEVRPTGCYIVDDDDDKVVAKCENPRRGEVVWLTGKDEKKLTQRYIQAPNLNNRYLSDGDAGTVGGAAVTLSCPAQS